MNRHGAFYGLTTLRPRHVQALGKLSRTLFVLSIAILLVSGLFPMIPTTLIPAEATPGNQGVGAAKDSGPSDAVIPDADRFPTPVEDAVSYGQDLEPLEPFKVPPGQSAKQALAGLVPDPLASGPNFDAFKTPDGATHARLVYPRVVNHQAPDGTWVPIVSHFTPEGAGWRGDLASGSVHLPGGLTPASGARLEVGGGSFSLTPTGATGAPGLLGDQGVSYPGGLAGADVAYDLRDLGLTERTTIAKKTVIPALSWNLAATGLAFRQEPAGEISVVSGTTVVGQIGAAKVTDAGGNPAPLTASYTLSGSTLTLTGDLSKAKFPAEVSVPITLGGGFNADTYVDQAAPETSFETAPQMKVSAAQSAFVHFDLATIAEPGTTVTTALLGLKGSHGNGKLQAQADAGRETPSSQPAAQPWTRQRQAPGTGRCGSVASARAVQVDHAAHR